MWESSSFVFFSQITIEPYYLEDLLSAAMSTIRYIKIWTGVFSISGQLVSKIHFMKKLSKLLTDNITDIKPWPELNILIKFDDIKKTKQRIIAVVNDVIFDFLIFTRSPTQAWHFKKALNRFYPRGVFYPCQTSKIILKKKLRTNNC